MYVRIHDAGMGPYPPRVALALRTPGWGLASSRQRCQETCQCQAVCVSRLSRQISIMSRHMTPIPGRKTPHYLYGNPYLYYLLLVFGCCVLPCRAAQQPQRPRQHTASDIGGRQPAISSQWLAPATDHHGCLSGAGETFSLAFQ